jgi:hypothetical protein
LDHIIQEERNSEDPPTEVVEPTSVKTLPSMQFDPSDYYLRELEQKNREIQQLQLNLMPQFKVPYRASFFLTKDA